MGDQADTMEGLRSACQDAADALALGARIRPRATVLRISDLRGPQALASLAPRARQRLVGGALGRMNTSADWPVLRATVIAWCGSGFNLVAASEALHIHRNTLVYRLDKIERLLEHPWRDHQFMLTLYLASLADHLQGSDPAG
jgi:carbohydrate diacid regulator